MAIVRDNPYGNFNFLVDLGDGTTEGPDGGFEEVSGLGIEVQVIEYRNGNEPASATRKLPGRATYPNAVLRRGLIGSLRLYQWIDGVRNGDVTAARTVRISLQNEDRTAIVASWMLVRAWPAKYFAPALCAKGNDVAIEELELVYERLEMD